MYKIFKMDGSFTFVLVDCRGEKGAYLLANYYECCVEVVNVNILFYQSFMCLHQCWLVVVVIF
jgi:hypothetical protein